MKVNTILGDVSFPPKKVGNPNNGTAYNKEKFFSGHRRQKKRASKKERLVTVIVMSVLNNVRMRWCERHCGHFPRMLNEWFYSGIRVGMSVDGLQKCVGL